MYSTLNPGVDGDNIRGIQGFLEISFNHMGDASQHTLENHKQDNGWVIQVHILS